MGVLAAVWYSDIDAIRLRILLAETSRVIPLAVIGGFAANAIALGVYRIINISALGSLATTVISLATVVLGTAAFLGVAILLGGVLYDWLSKRAAQVETSAH